MNHVITLAVVAATSFTVPTFARDNGQYAQADPGTREWFRNQLSPKTGGNCCSEADGVYAEEDIRGGHYWARFVALPSIDGVITETETGWMQVPDDVVIHDANRNGAPVVWWYYESTSNGVTSTSTLKIRCYAPGGGV